MRYVDTTTLSFAGGSAMVSDNWYANGLWDPYVAAGGHQPMGFDQLMTYYQFAFVSSSRIRASFSDNSGTLSEPIRCGVFLWSNTTTPYTTWTSFAEAGVRTAQLSGVPSRNTVATSSFSNRKMWGGSANESAIDYANSATANCVRLAQYRVWCQPEQVVTTTASIAVTVQIDYVVRFYNRNAIAAS